METMDSEFSEPAIKPTARQSFFRAVPWRGSDILIALTPLVLARVVPLVTRPAQLSAVPHWVWLPLTAAATGWMLLFPWVVARRRGVRLKGIAPLRSTVIDGLIALGLFPLILVLLGLLVQSLFALSGGEARPPDALERILHAPRRFEVIAFMFLAVFVAPITEETFFRGFLYNALRLRVPLAVAAVIQAVVFGVFHPFGPIHMAAIAFLGLVFALAYEWRQSLLVPMLLHMFQNALGVTALAIAAAGPVLGVGGNPHDGGLQIAVVAPQSAADAAGLRVGDIITAIDGKPVTDIQDVWQILRLRHVGDKIEVEFRREGTEHRVEAVLKPRGG